MFKRDCVRDGEILWERLKEGKREREDEIENKRNSAI